MRSSIQVNQRQMTAEKQQTNGLRTSEEMAANYYQRITEFNSKRQQKQNNNDRNATAISAGKKQIHSSLGRVKTETSYQRQNSNTRELQEERVIAKEQLQYHHQYRQFSTAAKIGMIAQGNDSKEDFKKMTQTLQSLLKNKNITQYNQYSQGIVEVDMSEFMQNKREISNQDNQPRKVEEYKEEYLQTTIPASSTILSLECSNSQNTQSSCIQIPHFQHHSNDLSQNHLNNNINIKNTQTNNISNAEKNFKNNSTFNKENNNHHTKNDQIKEMIDNNRVANPIIRSFTQPNVNFEENVQESFTDYQQNIHNYRVIRQAEILPNLRKSSEIKTRLLPFFQDEFKDDFCQLNDKPLLASTKTQDILTTQQCAISSAQSNNYQKSNQNTQQDKLFSDFETQYNNQTIQQQQKEHYPRQISQYHCQNNTISQQNLRYSLDQYDQTNIQFKIEQPNINKESVLKEIHNVKNQDTNKNFAGNIATGANITQLVSPKIQFEKYQFISSNPNNLGQEQLNQVQYNQALINANNKTDNVIINDSKQQNNNQQGINVLKTLSNSKSNCFSLQQKEQNNSAKKSLNSLRNTMEYQLNEQFGENNQLEKQNLNNISNQLRVKELAEDGKDPSGNYTDSSISKQLNEKYLYKESRSSGLLRNHSANKLSNNTDYAKASYARNNPREAILSYSNEISSQKNNQEQASGYILSKDTQLKNNEKIKLNSFFSSGQNVIKERLGQYDSNVLQQQPQEPLISNNSQGVLDCQKLIHRLEEIQREQQMEEKGLQKNKQSQGGLFLDEAVAQEEILELSDESSCFKDEQVILNNCSSQRQQELGFNIKEQYNLLPLEQQQYSSNQWQYQHSMPLQNQQYQDPEIKLKKPLFSQMEQQFQNCFSQDSHGFTFQAGDLATQEFNQPYYCQQGHQQHSNKKWSQDRHEANKIQERRQTYSLERRNNMETGQPQGFKETRGRVNIIAGRK